MINYKNIHRVLERCRIGINPAGIETIMLLVSEQTHPHHYHTHSNQNTASSSIHSVMSFSLCTVSCVDGLNTFKGFNDNVDRETHHQEPTPSSQIFSASSPEHDLLVSCFSSVWRLYATNDIASSSLVSPSHETDTGQQKNITPDPMGRAIDSLTDLAEYGQSSNNHSAIGVHQQPRRAGPEYVWLECGNKRAFYMLPIDDPLLREGLLSLSSDTHNGSRSCSGPGSKEQENLQPWSVCNNHNDNTILLCITADTSIVELGNVALIASRAQKELESLLQSGLLGEDTNQQGIQGPVCKQYGPDPGDMNISR